MKKITFLTICLVAIVSGFLKAQTTQGKILLGVSTNLSLAGSGSNLMTLGFSSVKFKSDADGFNESEPNKTTSLSLVPKVGYFVANNLAVGLDLNFSSSSNKDGNGGDKYTQSLLSVGPFVRYYIPTSKVLPYFEVGCSFGAINNKYDYSDNSFIDDEEFKSSIVSLGGGIGLAVPLGERVTIDMLAGYNSFTIKDQEDNDDNERAVIGTVGVKFGFTILLGSS